MECVQGLCNAEECTNRALRKIWECTFRRGTKETPTMQRSIVTNYVLSTNKREEIAEGTGQCSYAVAMNTKSRSNIIYYSEVEVWDVNLPVLLLYPVNSYISMPTSHLQNTIPKQHCDQCNDATNASGPKMKIGYVRTKKEFPRRDSNPQLSD